MKKIRIHLSFFIALLLLSGITAFPVQTEITFLYCHQSVLPEQIQDWIRELFCVIVATPDIMFYGTDWLAFGHIVISLFFVPVYIKPKQYIGNMYIGMTACLLVFPLAFIFGPIRGIPFFHQLIDCSFGLFGFLYLYFILKKINRLEPQNHAITT